MEFEYCFLTTAVEKLEIEDIGNCAIEAKGSGGLAYFLVIVSKLGTTFIFKHGPCILEDNNSLEDKVLPKKVNSSFETMIFNDKKLIDVIDRFLSDQKIGIIEAKIINKDEALNKCASIRDYMLRSKRVNDYA